MFSNEIISEDRKTQFPVLQTWFVWAFGAKILFLPICQSSGISPLQNPHCSSALHPPTATVLNWNQLQFSRLMQCGRTQSSVHGCILFLKQCFCSVKWNEQNLNTKRNFGQIQTLSNYFEIWIKLLHLKEHKQSVYITPLLCFTWTKQHIRC